MIHRRPGRGMHGGWISIYYLACRSSTSSGGFFYCCCYYRPGRASTHREKERRRKEEESISNGAPIIGAGAGAGARQKPRLELGLSVRLSATPAHDANVSISSISMPGRPASPTGHRARHERRPPAGAASRFTGPAPPSSRAAEVPSQHMMLKRNTCPGKTADWVVSQSVSELVLIEWRRTHTPAHCSLL